MSYDGNIAGFRNGSSVTPTNRLSGVRIAPVGPRPAMPTPRAPAPHGRTWRRMAAYLFAGGIAVASLGAGLRPWFRGQQIETAAKSLDAVPRAVSTARPHQQTVSDVTLPATVEAFQEAALYSRVSGYVKAWHAELGQNVTGGEVLAEIDTPELDQELLQARADLGVARAAVAQADAELREAQAGLERAQADRARSQADVELADSRLRRRAILLDKQAVSQDDHDLAVRDRAARQAELAASEAGITLQAASIGTRQAVVASRQAAQESAEANVRRLEQLQSFQRIRAPFDGVVIRRVAEVGMLVAAGNSAASEVLYEVAQTDRVRVQVQVPQSEASGVTVGSAVTVSIPERPDQSITAAVTRTSQSLDPATRTLLAEIELPNEAGLLPPGIYAEVAVRTHAPASTWLIPTNTVRMQVDGPHVVLANDSSRLEVRPVQLGRDFGRQVAVLEGISGAEQLVVNPADDLRNGMPVVVERREAGRAIAVR